MRVAGGGAAAAFGGGLRVPIFSVGGSGELVAGVDVDGANGFTESWASQARARFGNTIASTGPGAAARDIGAGVGGTEARPPKNGSSSVMDPRGRGRPPP